MTVLSQIIVLFSLILVGYVVKRLKIVSDEFQAGIAPLILNVTLPAFILSSMNFEFSVETLKSSGWLVAISFAMYGVAFVFSKLYSKVVKNSPRQRAVFEYAIMFSNSGYMGYPVVAQLFGEQGVFYAAIYNLSFSVLVWTYGVALLSGQKNVNIPLKKRLLAFINPGLVAVTLGFILFLFNLSLPPIVYNLLDMIGATTTPLSMMFIGFILTEIKPAEIFKNYQLLVVSIMRLIILPATTYLILFLFGFSGLTLYIPVVIVGMPVAVNVAIFASRYQADYQLGSLLIFTSTLLSVITVPIMMLLIQR